MDNLKKYLQQHADELDSEVPGDAVWQRIQNSAAPVLPKRKVLQMVGRYAAAACLLACIATGILYVNKKQSVTGEVAINTIKDRGQPLQTMVPTQPIDTTIITKNDTSGTVAPTPVKAIAQPNEYVNSLQPKQQPQIRKRTITIDPAQLLVQDVERNYTQLVNLQLERLKITPVYAESASYFSTFKQQLKQIEADEAAIKKDIRLHGLNDELLQQLININQQKLTVLKDLQAEISKLNNKVKSPETRADSSQAYYLTM